MNHQSVFGVPLGFAKRWKPASPALQRDPRPDGEPSLLDPFGRGGLDNAARSCDLVDGPVPGSPVMMLAALTGLGYVAGAVLLPLFFVLERRGKRGWRFYVPIAAVAGTGMGTLMAWPEPFSRPWGFYVIFAATAALCGGIFSVALAWRPETPLRPATRR